MTNDIILQQINILPLDANFQPCNNPANAVSQLETYRTQHKRTNVGTITKYTGNFSYDIGACVAVTPRIQVNSFISMNNMIKSEFMNQVIKRK